MLISVNWEKSLPLNSKSTIIKSKDNQLLNHSLIYSLKLFTAEDSSRIILSIWLLDLIRMEKVLSMDMMPLEVTEVIKPWLKDQVPIWSYHSWMLKSQVITIPITAKSLHLLLKEALRLFMKPSELLLKEISTLVISLKSSFLLKKGLRQNGNN